MGDVTYYPFLEPSVGDILVVGTEIGKKMVMQQQQPSKQAWYMLSPHRRY